MYVLKNPLEAVDVLIGVNVLCLFQKPSSGLGDFGKFDFTVLTTAGSVEVAARQEVHLVNGLPFSFVPEAKVMTVD